MKKEVVYLVFALAIVAFGYAFFHVQINDVLNEISGWATSRYFNVTVTLTNRDPSILNVSGISTQTLNEYNSTEINVTFWAYDPDGAKNLNASTAAANFTQSGEADRFNRTCIFSHDLAGNNSISQFNCSVNLWYWDDWGYWNVSVSIRDTSGSIAVNTSTIFNVSRLDGILIQPSQLTFPSMNPGSFNQTSNNDPIIVNNTGNGDITTGNVRVTAIDLYGESDNAKIIFANNVSIGLSNDATDCNPNAASASQMSNNTATSVEGSVLSSGNTSAGQGQEQLYVCLMKVGSELTSQTYSTQTGGQWVVDIQT